jgi:uncharacterized protein (TIGR02145 family)
MVTFDGHDYALVTIGQQCWFKENLRSEHYNDGSAIPEVQDDEEWGALLTGAQSYYGSNTANLDAYGRLYNWYAVDDERGLCPSGWHVPSNEEWDELAASLGGHLIAGIEMKSSATDTPPWNGSNSSGFSALPSGQRWDTGEFYGYVHIGYWWSTSELSSNTMRIRQIDSFNDDLPFGVASKRYGISIRCVRD